MQSIGVLLKNGGRRPPTATFSHKGRREESRGPSCPQRGLVRLGARDEFGAALGLQQSDDLGVGPGAAEQEALPLVAALGAQAAQFGLGLAAFGGEGTAETLSEACG